MNTSTASEAATVDLKKLKGYPFLFFLSNLFHFKRKYWLTFWNGITIGIFSFGQAYLISDAINSYDTITTEKLLSLYLPASIGIFLFPEGLGYLQRKYGEAIPIHYQDFLQTKVAEQLMTYSSYPLINANKERLHQLLRVLLLVCLGLFCQTSFGWFHTLSGGDSTFLWPCACLVTCRARV